MREFNYECAYCGSKENLNMEHLIPQRKCAAEYPEITDLQENLIVNCQNCNMSRNDTTPIQNWYKKQPFYTEERFNKIIEHWEKYHIIEQDRLKLHNEILGGKSDERAN